jgi:phenylalanyl-tRNA synthetase alpha chain
MNTLTILLNTAKQAIQQAPDIATLENLRVKYLGKKGELTELLKSVAQMPPEQRSTLGKTINQAKVELQALIEQQLKTLQDQVLQAQLAAQRLDVTLRGRFDTPGTVHPINQVCERVTELLMSLGFTVAQGPEIEDDYHNFSALNIPLDHPARAMQDTFYFADHRLLRTHTSPVQIREMKKHGVPVRLIALGRVYRRDLDQTHTPMFHQLEGLVVDKHCTFADLKGLLKQFLSRFFETDIQLRFRPSYFPFTEPSAEVDIYQPKTQRWLEILGCGMVHANVLRNVGVNPEEYSGFAFGIGLDRLAMLRYEVQDLRLFFENDLRFLEQF